MDGISIAKMQKLEESALSRGATLPQLMEKAGHACANLIEEHMGMGNNFLIFCGPGNNGGDGFVCARYLQPRNKVKIALPIEPKTPAASENFVQARKKGIEILSLEDAEPILKSHNPPGAAPSPNILIDALLGVGSTLPLRGKIKNACTLINSTRSLPIPPKIISIDVPTGMDADTGETDKDGIRPYATICIHAPKTGELKAGMGKTGKLLVADIGLDK